MSYKVKKLTKEQAINAYESEFWLELTPEQRGLVQLFIDRLVMPFDVFHEGVEALLNRQVWTHEFAYADELRKECITGDPGISAMTKLLRTHKIVGVM